MGRNGAVFKVSNFIYIYILLIQTIFTSANIPKFHSSGLKFSFQFHENRLFMQCKQVGWSENMEINRVLLVGCFLILLAVGCSYADTEVKATPNTSLDVKSPITLNENNNTNVKEGGLNQVLDSVKKDGDKVDMLKKDVQNDLNKSNLSKQQESEEDHNGQIDQGEVNGEVQVKEGEEKGNSSNELESKKMPKNNEGTSVKLTPLKEGTQGEECDASNRCIDEVNKLVACLRVPGDESPDLSLLIQNKGKVSLDVTISAPEYVQLEETKIQLQEKKDKRLKVSISDGGPDTLIILMAGNGRCSLDFRDVIMHNSRKETDTVPKFKYTIFQTRTPSIAFISLAALLIIASAWMCVSFWRRHFPSNGSKYQKLETELPVSGGGKTKIEINDGWDNSWDDNWDDEEAPRTPSKPVTPSLSSKGLASRRINKEAWKD